MKMNKNVIMIIAGAVILFLIYWLFLRKKKSESSYDDDLLNVEENGYVRCADTTSIACCVAKYLDKNGHTADNYIKARKLCGGSSAERQADDKKPINRLEKCIKDMMASGINEADSTHYCKRFYFNKNKTTTTESKYKDTNN